MKWRGCHLITPSSLLCISVPYDCQTCIMLVPNLTPLLPSERVPEERDRTQRVPGCYPPHNFPFITRHPASLSIFLQMKFLSHHQGEARAAWKRYATSGKRKEICKLNSLFIDIIGSYQLLIPTPDRTKLHGLAESKITVLRIILGHRIKCLGRYLRVHFLLPIHFAKKETETRGR